MKAYGDAVLRRVRWHMYRYDEIKSAVGWARREQKRHIKNTDGIRAQGTPSDPTGNEAIRNLMPIEYVNLKKGIVYHPEEWIAAIDAVLCNLSRDDSDLFKAAFRYQKPVEDICDSFIISRVTYYKRRDRIVTLVSISAASKGLIRVE